MQRLSRGGKYAGAVEKDDGQEVEVYGVAGQVAFHSPQETIQKWIIGHTAHSTIDKEEFSNLKITDVPLLLSDVPLST